MVEPVKLSIMEDVKSYELKDVQIQAQIEHIQEEIKQPPPIPEFKESKFSLPINDDFNIAQSLDHSLPTPKEPVQNPKLEIWEHNFETLRK